MRRGDHAPPLTGRGPARKPGRVVSKGVSIMTIIKRLAKNGAAAVAAATLLATPTLATAATNPAATLSVAKSARASAPSPKSSKIAAGGTATLINIGILAALVVVVLVATGGDDDSDSN
jgi:hypothetical protein